MRLRAKRDANENAVVQALEACGAQVIRLSGKDIPDLLVRCGAFQNVSDVPPGRTWGKYVLMEVKSAKGPIKAGQKALQATWPEIVVVRSVSEALAAIGVKGQG